MRRKSTSRLAGDIGAYVTGRSEISLEVPSNKTAYPVDWRYMLADQRRYFEPFDDTGLPMKVFPGSTQADYLPSRLASWALAHWDTLQSTGSCESRTRFLHAADWFAQQADGLYHHRYGMSGLGVTRPWLSALAQGQAISVLTRANLLTGDRQYLNVAAGAARPLTTPCEEGGVASILPDAGPFLEEYPDRGGTLNGCLLAIVGMDDLIGAGAGDHLIDFRDGLLETIADQAESWERGGWSLYSYAPVGSSIAPNFNTMRYHYLHVRLLDHFACCTGDTRLLAAAARTRSAGDQLGLRLRALAMKISFRLRSGW